MQAQRTPETPLEEPYTMSAKSRNFVPIVKLPKSSNGASVEAVDLKSASRTSAFCVIFRSGSDMPPRQGRD